MKISGAPESVKTNGEAAIPSIPANFGAPNGVSSGDVGLMKSKGPAADSSTPVKPTGKPGAPSGLKISVSGKPPISSRAKGKAIVSNQVEEVIAFKNLALGPHEGVLRFRLIHFWEAWNSLTKVLIGLELLLIDEEAHAGRLKFVCYYNDCVDEHMMCLVGLKNIFARQLPNMYIVRLLMDRKHKSVMVVRPPQVSGGVTHVVGGITYRPYHRFGEISFCAITADEQVKGYGTRLMNHLKEHARNVDGLTQFLTYADNNVVGYFVNQVCIRKRECFRRVVGCKRETWKMKREINLE